MVTLKCHNGPLKTMTRKILCFRSQSSSQPFMASEKMLFGPKDNFILQYLKWPLGKKSVKLPNCQCRIQLWFYIQGEDVGSVNMTVGPSAQDTGGRLAALWAAISLLPLAGVYFAWSERRGDNTSSGVPMSTVSHTKSSSVFLQAATYLQTSIQRNLLQLTKNSFNSHSLALGLPSCFDCRAFRPQLRRWRPTTTPLIPW